MIGEKRARELILTGEIIDAVEAGRLGLCNHVVPGAHLEPKLLEVLSKLKELSGTSLGFARQSLDLGRGRSIEEALSEQENIYLHELMKTAGRERGREGVHGETKTCLAAQMNEKRKDAKLGSCRAADLVCVLAPLRRFLFY